MKKTNLPTVIQTSIGERENKKKPNALSPFQRRWRDRSGLFWRLKGMKPFAPRGNVDYVTQKEMHLLRVIDDCIKQLNDNYTDSSIELGFNAKHRCWCGKEFIIVFKGQQLCKEHYENNHLY